MIILHQSPSYCTYYNHIRSYCGTDPMSTKYSQLHNRGIISVCTLIEMLLKYEP